MDDLENLVQLYSMAGARQAVSQIDANPDQAAEAKRLSDASGVPPLAAFNDFDAVSKQFKSSLASDIIYNDPVLNRYAQEHPLHPAISNDDWGNLFNANEAARRTADIKKTLDSDFILTGKLPPGVDSPVQRIGEELSGPLGQWAQTHPILQGFSPNVRRLIGAVASPGELALRGVEGVFSEIPAVAGETARMMALDVYGFKEGVITGQVDPNAAMKADQFGRGVAGMTESFLLNQGAEIEGSATARQGHMIRAQSPNPEVAAAAQATLRGHEAADTAKQWLDAGLEPPAGLHPLIDEIKQVRNAAGVNSLRRDLDAAIQSSTRERDPNAYESVMEQHFGNSHIGISSDGVLGLYGDRMPAPDDGLLGWVPGIADQIQVAKETGEDIKVPIKSWLARVDPALAEQLSGDLRMWPGGITTRDMATSPGIIADTAEAQFGVTVSPPAYPPVVDAPMPQVRFSVGTEPMFSIGDRKLQLQRVGGYPSLEGEAAELAARDGFQWENLSLDQAERYISRAEISRPFWQRGLHDFHLLDQDGKTVGTLNLSEQKGGKDIYVEMISGVNGFGVRDFGPSLIRDLKRQLKVEFPNAEWLVGDRVSGMREKFGTEGLVRVKLDAEPIEASEKFRQILEGGEWKAYHPGAEGYVKAKFDPQTQAINDAIREEYLKRVPKGDIQFVQRIRAGGSDAVRGAHFTTREMNGLTLLATDVEDRMGVMHHEAIHALRDFFTDREWMELQRASVLGDWQGKFDIARWDKHNLSNSQKLEESIAEAYRAWEAGRAEATPQVHGIFQKIKDFLDAIRKRINDILGRPGTVDDIFERVSSGEVGGREVKGEFGEPKFSVGDVQGPEKPTYLDQLNALRANATGLDVKTYEKLTDLYKQQHVRDLEAARARAEKEQTREQTKAWKADQAETKKAVEERLRARPDIAADLFFSHGDLFGRKVDPIRIASDSLSDAQKAALPRNYYGKVGLPADILAKTFGYTSGDAMIEGLAKLRQTGESALERVGRLVKDETARQMQEKYGVLQDNIMEAAKDQAAAEVDVNLLAEEMYAAASIAKVPVVDKAVMQAQVDASFGKRIAGQVSSHELAGRMKKYGDDAFKAVVNGDPASAIPLKQQQVMAAMAYVKARAVEDIYKNKFPKLVKGLRKVELDGIEPQYRNFIHQILDQIGLPSRRLPGNIAEDIAARGDKDFASFLEDKAKMGYEVPVLPELLTNWRKAVDEMTVDEFLGTYDTLRTLKKNGRDELKLTLAGEARDLDEFKASLIGQLRQLFEPTPSAAVPTKGLKYGSRLMLANSLKLEAVFNRWDLYNKFGPWQSLLRELIDSDNHAQATEKHFAKILREIDDGADLTKLIDNPLRIGDPRVPGSVMQLNVGHRRAIMLNAGTKSNLEYFKNWGVKPEDVLEWVKQTATKEDWDFVQNVWDRIFKDLKSRSDTMYRSMTGGVAAESIPAQPIDTPHGRYAGGYYPAIFHEEIEGKVPGKAGKISDLLDPSYYKATVPAGYTKARLGHDAPLSLDINQMGGRIKQMIHDIEMRPAVIQAAKIFYDKKIRAEIGVRAGAEYVGLLEPYLRDVANSANFKSEWDAFAERTSEFFRQNAVFTVVGLNPSTLFKHGPTALVQSAIEVGGIKFAREMFNLLHVDERTGESNWRFAMDTSVELQRRVRNARETLYGSTADLSLRGQGPKAQYLSLRDQIMEFSSKPVALSDLISAVPTWLTAWREAKEAGMSDGEAVAAGDRAVRFAHGSSSTTSRPAIMRGGPIGQWLVTIYNFYSHMWQKNMEIYWRSRDALKLRQLGDLEKAQEITKSIPGMVFAYVLAPTAIAMLVGYAAGQKIDSWGKYTAESLLHHQAGNIPILRDAVDGWLHKKDPQVGLLSTEFTLLHNFVRDLGKEEPLSREHMGRLIQDFSGTLGASVGLMPQEVGRWIRAVHDVRTGQARPETLGDKSKLFFRGSMENPR